MRDISQTLTLAYNKAMKDSTTIQWKWTTGENVERSKRKVIPNTNGINVNDTSDGYQKTVEKFAYDASLHHDENSWELYNTTQMNSTSLQQSMESKREDTDKRMAERQMFSQKSLNPYLTNNDYVNDIVVSNNFLKPISTTTEKEM